MAEDGTQVLVLLESGRSYDCILMDGFMPELDGYEATKIIRAKGNKIPVIAVTANAMSGERERCLALGMNDFITKPVVREQLVAALTRVLKVNIGDQIK
jgi:CheY-like chemotaxis protein